MLKKVLKSLCSTIMRAMSYIYPYSLSQRIIVLRNNIYTLWLRNFIGGIGRDTLISYPVTIEGGGAESIIIGHNTVIKSNCIIGSWNKYRNQFFSPRIIIGDNCSIGEYNHITAVNEVSIGNGLLTGRFVYIGDNAHGKLSFEEASVPPAERLIVSKGAIVIGENVWIGDKATILGGVSIGDNAIIAANTVVTKNVPANCIVAGVPGRIVKRI